MDTGVYGEQLVVTGDARVTGILTIGTGSITLDPSEGQLTGLDKIVATSGEFSGNVSVGGTLTYDDVTFLDSIGLATARSGLDVCAGSITPVISLQAATTTLDNNKRIKC